MAFAPSPEPSHLLYMLNLLEKPHDSKVGSSSGVEGAARGKSEVLQAWFLKDGWLEVPTPGNTLRLCVCRPVHVGISKGG